ncbi:DUF485 domain-containing protein [Ornithinibacillus halotolerans]|uniref:DUF485 domain-containing protein n=1 Tax=Ornithinibacillus halotolerans TaxID=1274357 RepID=A0A916SEV5_9BACI|nr:DUF485 domain-containing protein [Ornithinibacillus halotolerans]GGA93051.1 hypothetical protein GCM10008025_39290 [Ornithinibacillus halotolerans]
MEERMMYFIRRRNKLLVPIIILVFLFYFMLPLSLIFLPDVMNQTSFIPGITWAWLYAFLQIPMTWTVGWIYHIKAKKFDEQIEKWEREESV